MKKWKRKAAILTAAVMAAGLTACGGGGANGNAGQNGKSEASAEAKQYVYSYQDISTEEIPAGSSIREVFYKNGKIQALYDCYGDTEYIALLSVNPDGTQTAVVNLPLQPEAETDGAYMNAAAMAEDGTLYLVKGVSSMTDADTDVYEEKLLLQSWSQTGDLLWEQELSADTSGAYLNTSAMAASEDGVQLVINSDTTWQLVSFDTNGEKSEEQSLDGNGLDNLYEAVPEDDGTWFFLCYNNDYTSLNATGYDPAAGRFSEPVALPAGIQNYQASAGTDGGLLLVNQDGVSEWKQGDETVTKRMGVIESDLDAGSISYPVWIGEDQFAAAYYDAQSYDAHLAVFTKVAPENVPDKQTLVLGGYYIGQDVRSRVIAFNRENQEYRITVKDYSSDMADISAIGTQLNTDILAGNMPDILLVDSNIDLANFAEKGLLADVGALIAQDSELSARSFLDNVFDAFRIKDKLYQVVPSFTVSTFIGKKSVLGDRNGWNMEEFLSYVSGLGNDVSAFGEVTRDSFLSYAMQYGGNDYIDRETGKCSFDSPEFVKLIQYAATLPQEIDYGEDYDWTAYANQYRESKTLLMPLYLYDFSSLSANINGSFGEEIAYVGFPSAGKDGSAVLCDTSFALSAKSKYQDAAWQFVRYYLTEAYQSSDVLGGMPVDRDCFMQMAQKAMQKPYYLDENGQKVEYDDIYYLNDEEIVLPPLTQEQLDQAVSFVEGINRTVYHNDTVMQIINEELPAFFEGQQDAEKVAEVIQNRVQLYLDENN